MFWRRISDPKRLQVQLKRQVESAVIDQLEALQLGNGISYTTDMKRYYPFGQLFTQLIGFTGIETEGQTGLEAEYNTYLAGTAGRNVIEVDRKNNPLSYGEQDYLAPDRRLQHEADRGLCDPELSGEVSQAVL